MKAEGASQNSGSGQFSFVTRQEYARAYQVSRRWVTAGVLLLTILWFCVFLSAGSKVKTWFRGSDAAELSWIALSLALFVAGVFCIARIVYKRHGLVCPSCGDWIASQPMILKTGRCPRCKKEMFHDG